MFGIVGCEIAMVDWSWEAMAVGAVFVGKKIGCSGLSSKERGSDKFVG